MKFGTGTGEILVCRVALRPILLIMSGFVSSNSTHGTSPIDTGRRGDSGSKGGANSDGNSKAHGTFHLPQAKIAWIGTSSSQSLDLTQPGLRAVVSATAPHFGLSPHLCSFFSSLGLARPPKALALASGVPGQIAKDRDRLRGKPGVSGVTAFSLPLVSVRAVTVSCRH